MEHYQIKEEIQAKLKFHLSHMERIDKIIEKLEQEIKLFEQDKEYCARKFVESLGISLNKEYTLKVKEFRDDNISLFQAEQECKVLLSNLRLSTGLDKTVLIPQVEKIIFGKSGKPLTKKGKIVTKKIHFNPFLSWQLFDTEGVEVLSHESKQLIIQGKYTDEEINRKREVSANVQKF